MHRVKTSCSPAASEHDIRLEGEIDLSAQLYLSAALELLRTCTHHDVCVDASAVEFVDSTGLTFLAHLSQVARERHGTVRVTGPPRQFLRLIEMTSLPVVTELDPVASCGSAEDL